MEKNNPDAQKKLNWREACAILGCKNRISTILSTPGAFRSSVMAAREGFGSMKKIV